MVIKKHLHVFVSLSLFISVLWAGQAFGFWQLKSDEIGGDTLIIEVSNRFGIPLEVIYETWNIPGYVSSRAELSEARDEAGFSMGRFKIWVTADMKENNPLASAGLAETELVENDSSGLNITGAITLRELSYYFGIPRADIYKRFSLPDSLPPETTVRELREAYGVEMGEIKTWLQIFSDGLSYYQKLMAGERVAPDDIREWMTLEQVSQATGIPLDYIYAQAALSSQIKPASTIVEIKAHTGFTIEAMRNLTSEYYLLNQDSTFIAPQLPSPAGTPPDTGRGKNRRP